MTAPFGSLGTIQTLTVGGFVFTDIANLIVLIGTQSTGNYSTLVKLDGTPYQVPGGKTFKIYATRCLLVDTSPAGQTTNLGYGDNNVGEGGSAPTNGKYMGETGLTGGNGHIFLGAQLQTEVALPSGFSVPASKFPFIGAGSGSVNCWIFGYEV